MRTVFIDGYNVINSWQELKDLEFGIAREKLIEFMVNYASYYDSKVVVVFDAHRVAGGSEKRDTLDRVEIVFTKDGETADAFIEHSVDQIGKRVEVLVVTSDSLEQQIIFGRGATRMSSKEFRAEFKDAERSIREKTRELSDKVRHTLAERVDEDALEKLEKMRRDG